MEKILARIVIVIFFLGIIALFVYQLIIYPFNHFYSQYGFQLAVIGCLIFWIFIAILVLALFYLAKLIFWALDNF